jgi:hypothetical protein
LQFAIWVEKTAANLDSISVLTIVRRLEAALQQMESNLNTRLLFENILLDWPMIDRNS